MTMMPSPLPNNVDFDDSLQQIFYQPVVSAIPPPSSSSDDEEEEAVHDVDIGHSQNYDYGNGSSSVAAGVGDGYNGYGCATVESERATLLSSSSASVSTSIAAPTDIHSPMDPPNYHRIHKRRHSTTNNSILSYHHHREHPEDESSTFLRGRNHLRRWLDGALLCRYIRQLGLVCYRNMIDRRVDHTAAGVGGARKTDVTKLVALLILAMMAFVFMEVGTSSVAENVAATRYTNSYSSLSSEKTRGDAHSARNSAKQSTIYNTVPKNIRADTTSAAAAGMSTLKGYQARSQVPIPIEYANFVELSEFAQAVSLVRAHRHKMMMMMQQQGQHMEQQPQLGQQGQQIQPQLQGQPHGRRLDDTDNNAPIEEENGEQKVGENADPNTNNNGEAEVVNNNEATQNEEQQINAQENTNNNKNEEDEMSNAIEASWKQVNPEVEKQQKERDPNKLLKVNHVPFFWHIPRTSGTTLSTLLATCHLLVQATSSFSSPPVFLRGNDPALASRFRDPTLYVVRTKGQQFVNVDLDSMEGVQRAVNGKLIEKELADVVSVPDVRLGSLLFGNGQNKLVAGAQDGHGDDNIQKDYKGVLFSMFRHPIDRAVSTFYHKQSVKDSVHHDPSLEIYTLTDWINSPGYITDYMVRTLVGKIDSWAAPDPNQEVVAFRPPVPLTPEDLDVAKEILRRKCVVGLLEEKGESMKRFEKFFGWNADVSRDSLFIFEDEQTAAAMQAERWKNIKDEECRERLLHWNWANKNKHPPLEEGSLAYNLLESKNRYDIELYMYARQLFEEQFFQLGFDDDDGGDEVVGD